VNLTEKAIDRLEPTTERQNYRDDETTGFGIRIEPAASGGRKSFFWNAKVGGQVVFKSLGESPAVSVKDARDSAREWAGKAAKWKQDGFPEPGPFLKPKRAAQPESSAVPLFKDLVEKYVEDYLKPNAKNPEVAMAEVRRRSKKYFKAWQDRPLDSLSAEDLLEVKNACGKHHTTANCCIELISRLLNWAAGRRKGKAKGKARFWTGKNFAEEVEGYDKNERDRTLSADELKRFNEELEKEEHRDLRDFLVLSMNSAARKGDILSMRWCDIDWDRNHWHVPNPKNKVPYNVWMLPAFLNVLKRRESTKPESAIHVFPGSGKSGHVIDVKKPWKKFRAVAKLSDFRIHDIRHTVLSAMAEAGVPILHVGAAAGHQSVQSTKRYIHLYPESQREARMKGQQKMIALIKSAKKREKASKPKLLQVSNA
jgi:integrase